MTRITVQNIVTSADLGESLNLNAIAIGLGLEHIEYEPEQFPGSSTGSTSPTWWRFCSAAGSSSSPAERAPTTLRPPST